MPLAALVSKIYIRFLASKAMASTVAKSETATRFRRSQQSGRASAAGVREIPKQERLMLKQARTSWKTRLTI